ncbi:peptidoglycan DD-metalloendopeptidase family protein [Chloroflexota bacterium]
MQRKLVVVLFLIFSSIYFVLFAISTTAAPVIPTKSPIEEEKDKIEQAILDAVQGEREYVLGYLVHDIQVAEVQISEDGTWGIAYLEMIDPQTGEVLPTEPGLAIARRVGADWQVTLPADPEWLELMKSAPEDLLNDEYKVSFEDLFTVAAQDLDATYSGYLLPWEAGKTVYLSQSIGHDQYIPSESAHYSFDFYIHKTMYRLHASKAGTVWRTRWDAPNGDDSDMGNYIVLKDTSTTPTTYQLYLHLAQDSIPQELRAEGAYVAQGDFIGIADDTGKSTGHHLHFHVHTNPDSYWGISVDITFDDVDINGGRPRRESDLPYCTRPNDVCNKFRNNYISGNSVFDEVSPPTGDLFEPSTGLKATSPSVHVDGWANDENSGLARARLLAYFNNSWHEVGDEITNLTFNMDWDMCTDNVPDGPVSLALRAWDNAGNQTLGLPGLTHIIKEYSCEQAYPACTPDANQIAIFEEVDYHGTCKIFDLGEFSDSGSFNSIGDNDVESILVGSTVMAELFSATEFSERSETLIVDDSNLDDNPIGGNNLSSFKVSLRSDPPSAPQELLTPLSSAQYQANPSISFAWRDPGGATQFQVYLEGPLGNDYSPWLSNSFWNPEGINFQEGSYSWKVRARNCTNIECRSAWSSISTFSVSAAPASLQSISVPFSDDIESGSSNWHSTGLWHRIDDVDRSHSQSYSWYYGLTPDQNYDTGTPNSGDLTLRPLSIPNSNYVLRFWYRYDTEGPGKIWDQRWIQVSTDGESFENVIQLNDDVENYWLQATVDLSEYAGQTINVRFHFASLDDQHNNDNEGWNVDDIELIEITPPACSDIDNTPTEARTLSFGETISGKMCPTGDVDYYKFEGVAGDHIALNFDTPAQDPIEDLDLITFLIDNDGSSVLAIHDDEIFGEMFDPHLGYLLSRSGTYYVRARLWSHPTRGGEEFTYDISLTKDNDKPVGEFTYPISNTYLLDSNNLTLEVNAADQDSGLSHVEFLYHSGDWLSSNWQVLGKDQDGTDGWKTVIDTTTLPEQKDISFFAKMYDWAGNWTGAGVWNIGLDRTPPITSLKQLNTDQESTAILLEWTSNDNLSGIEYYELQNRINNGVWSDINPNSQGSINHTWYIGQPDTGYSFRLRGVDFAGNQEAFPTSAEAETSIPSISSLCSSPDAWDIDGDDNYAANAAPVEIEQEPKNHNFCNPLASDRLNDEDWVQFPVEEGETYIMESTPQAIMTGTILELYAIDGTTLISSAQSSGFGDKSQLIWTADRDDQVYLRVRHLDGKVAGNIVAYQLRINRFLQNFLPIIQN